MKGWANKGREKGPDTTLWSVADEAEVAFFVGRITDLSLTFRCAPARGQSGGSSSISLAVNGTAWTVVPLRPDMRRYSLKIPADRLVVGQNRLTIEHLPVRDSTSSTSKDLRVLWDYIRFGERDQSAATRPFVREDRKSLFIPFGMRVDYFLDLPRRSVLRAEMVRTRGLPTGRLEVSWTSTDGETAILTADFTGVPDGRLKIDNGQSMKGRLSLFSLAPEDTVDDPTAGILLVDPMVRSAGGGKPLPDSPQLGSSPTVEQVQPRATPNVIVYLIDTLRADHLSCYGYERRTSPRLDQFANQAVLFENAQAQSPWTRASVASIFTGLWPQQHAANDDPDKLSEQALTLAELLSQVGYTTAAISGNSNASNAFGFAQGFDHFQYLRRLRPGKPLARSTDINSAVFSWLERDGDRQPFLLFVHTIDPHAPYEPPEPFRSQFAASVSELDRGSLETIQALNRQVSAPPEETLEDLIDLYDAEIAANDHSFGVFIDELERRDLLEGALVFVVSDHGEEFFDHGGWTHGKTLHTEMLDVPLVIKLPGQSSGKRVWQVVQHVDLLPTIADYLGIALPSNVVGRSLLPLLNDPDQAEWPDRAVSYVNLRGRAAASYLDSSWKLIQSRDEDFSGIAELYDRRSDRGENHDLGRQRHELASYLASVLSQEEAALPDGHLAPPISDSEMVDLEEDLRALGYIE